MSAGVWTTAGVWASDAEFSGTVPSSAPVVGTNEEIDVSSYFTNVISYSVVPAVTGVSVNASGVVTIVTPSDGDQPHTIVPLDIVIRGTATNATTADSNTFTVTWDLTSWGATRAEIEAADETSGANPPFLEADFDGTDLSTDRFRTVTLVSPTEGTWNKDIFSRGIFSGASEGTYFATEERFKNNVSYGSADLNFNVQSINVVEVINKIYNFSKVSLVNFLSGLLKNKEINVESHTNGLDSSINYRDRQIQKQVLDASVQTSTDITSTTKNIDIISGKGFAGSSVTSLASDSTLSLDSTIIQFSTSSSLKDKSLQKGSVSVVVENATDITSSIKEISVSKNKSSINKITNLEASNLSLSYESSLLNSLPSVTLKDKGIHKDFSIVVPEIDVDTTSTAKNIDISKGSGLSSVTSITEFINKDIGREYFSLNISSVSEVSGIQIQKSKNSVFIDLSNGVGIGKVFIGSPTSITSFQFK